MDSAALLTLQSAQAQAATAQQTQATAALTGKTGKSNAKLGLDFETMCLTNLLSPMFEGLSTDGPFGGGHAEETMRSFYVGAMAKEMAQRGGIGISDMMQSQLLKLQEKGAA
ncbi:rod-binding protein [Asticcacaulis taihuensis]|uniref:Rod binding protein n=1 Tax=Asticcacaulis taihuensis TaxID=260084 RepID=A0A1G4Q0B3_9CAUL|nr:rod-binding protein [Asticcacaulis taihuensis]SCW38030.1 Rod binding protein [Asticcacaulis taihuensis]